MDSLTYQRRAVEEKPIDEIRNENYKRFVQGYNSPKGPIQWMTEEQKARVHDLVDKKLQELEDTGLSREELLYEGKIGGVPLSLDPFFKLLKYNRLAREILFKPGEEFSVGKVVDMALRQDIGPDPALSRRSNLYLYQDQIDETTRHGLAKNLVHDRKEFDPNTYFSEHHNKVDMETEVMSDPDKRFFTMPRTRVQAWKNNLREFNDLDVHWRNTEFLTKFMGDAGKIRNKFQNRLMPRQQELVAKTIKQARHLLMLPHVGFIKPSDKRSLRTLQEDIQDFLRKKINIETGTIYFEEPGQRFASENPYRVEDPSQFDKEGFEGIKDLEFEFMPSMPTSDEVQLLEAQHYAKILKKRELKKQGLDIDKLKKLRTDDMECEHPFRPVDKDEEVDIPEEELARFSQSFEQIKEEVKELPVTQFIEAFVSEKGVNPRPFKKQSNYGTGSKKSTEELLNEIEGLKRELGL